MGIMNMHSFKEIKSIVVQECKLKGYSLKTIENYLHHIRGMIASKRPTIL